MKRMSRLSTYVSQLTVAIRVIHDAHGIEWQVWPVIPMLLQRALPHRTPESRSHLLPELQGGWLAFQSAFERRRLTPIPADWEALSAERLADLLADATPVPDRRRGDADSASSQAGTPDAQLQAPVADTGENADRPRALD